MIIQVLDTQDVHNRGTRLTMISLIHSVEVCALFPTRLDRLRLVSRTTWCLRNRWPRHNLSKTLTLYSRQSGTQTFPLDLLVHLFESSYNLLNYARAHNSLWLHTEVSRHEISYDPFEPGWRTEEKSHGYSGIPLGQTLVTPDAPNNPPRCVLKLPP